MQYFSSKVYQRYDLHLVNLSFYQLSLGQPFSTARNDPIRRKSKWACQTLEMLNWNIKQWWFEAWSETRLQQTKRDSFDWLNPGVQVFWRDEPITIGMSDQISSQYPGTTNKINSPGFDRENWVFSTNLPVLGLPGSPRPNARNRCFASVATSPCAAHCCAARGRHSS